MPKKFAALKILFSRSRGYHGTPGRIFTRFVLLFTLCLNLFTVEDFALAMQMAKAEGVAYTHSIER